ncbi:MAG: ABC transporter [Clostridia bacterium]|nr:MAG: ABC transporter [Clostridia bacterium]
MKVFIADTWWVCWRELKHLQRQKIRIMLSLAQPIVWLALMGNLYQRIATIPGFPAPTYLDYMAPGIVIMVTLFGGVFGGMSVVWDRRLGFLQKMLASPVSRSSIVAGKMLSIAVQNGLQALLIFGLALAMGANFSAGPVGVFPLILLVTLLSMVFAGLSLALGAVLTSHEAMIAVTNFFTMPLMFTSSAMMPLEMMPHWLSRLARWNPLTYAIDPMRELFLHGWNAISIVQGVVVLTLAAAVAAVLATNLFKGHFT